MISVINGTFTWNGGGADNMARDRFNSSRDVAPINGDNIIFDSTSTKTPYMDAALPSSPLKKAS